MEFMQSPPRPLFAGVLSVLLVTTSFLVSGNLTAAYGATSISYDFDTAGDLAGGFDSYISSGTPTQSSTGGIGNTGAIYAASSADAVYTTKSAYSIGPVESSYTFTALMKSVYNSGYSGIGFTAATASAASTGGSPFRSTDALGISVHGGGYVFHNGGTDIFGNWNSDTSGVTTIKQATIADLLNNGSPDKWYKIVFKLTRDSATTFDARVEVWPADSSGALLRPAEADAIFEFEDQSNTDLINAPAIYSYINFSGSRVEYFDDYQVDLAGGSTVITQGSPVVLTSSVTETSGVVSYAGNVTSDGGAAVTERGFVYDTATAPLVSDSKVLSGTGTGSFSGTTPRLANGTYYFRSFATNSTGTSYGSEETITVTDGAVTGGSSGGSSGSGSSSPSTLPVETPAVASPSPAPQPFQPAPVAPNTNPVPRPVERLGLVFDPDGPSRATVGGVPANLLKTPVGSDRLSVTAGAFQFGVSLADADGAEVQTETPSQSPELFVPRGQSAEVFGKGSYPGSFVQLFLPGNGNFSRELARIPVRSDGTFASDLSFQAGALELPVPIGRQVLQVVGYDELGNQTVVDMTINIGQGVPAPEPNRQAGALPALTAGQSLATSGGIPETVSVTGVPEAGNVVVEGSGWVISVNADRDNGVVENADGNVLVRLNPSSVGTTFGNGFLPGTLATVWLFSEPTLMTTVTVDDNGEFSAEFLVDARLIAPGEHTLQVQGVGSDGYIKAANLGVLVEEPVELTTESASGLLWWVIGAFLLALLFLLVLVARRRRSQEQ